MQIFRSGLPVKAHNVDELRAQIQFRDSSGFASFWLWHDNGAEMAVMLNGQQAHIHFFPNDGSEGAYSLATVPPEHPEETVEFVANTGEPNPVRRRMVIDMPSAEEAIIFFFKTGERSDKLTWEDM